MYSCMMRPYLVKEPSIGAQRHQLLDRIRHLVFGGIVQCRFLFGILCRGKCLARYMYMSGSSALQSPPSSIYTHPTSLPPPPSYSLPSPLPCPPPPLLPTRTPHTPLTPTHASSVTCASRAPAFFVASISSAAVTSSVL